MRLGVSEELLAIGVDVHLGESPFLADCSHRACDGSDRVIDEAAFNAVVAIATTALARRLDQLAPEGLATGSRRSVANVNPLLRQPQPQGDGLGDGQHLRLKLRTLG